MPVLYSLDEVNVGTAQFLFEPVCQPSALVRSEMAAVVVLYPAAFHTDDIAAHGQVARLKIVADTRRFKGAAPFIYLVLVVTEDAAVCHLTAWQEPVGHGNQSAAASLPRQHIHVWGVGILQRGLSTEPFHPVVCHSVAQDYYVLHILICSFWQPADKSAYILAIDIILAKTPAAVTPAPAPYPCICIGYSR